MSSIAAPSRTDRVGTTAGATHGLSVPAAGWLRALRLALATVILTLLLVTFTPFVLKFDPQGGGGNVLNQIGYGVLGAVAIGGHFLFTDRAVALSLLRPAWLVILAVFAFSCTGSLSPPDALRAVLFSTIAMIAATGAVCLPANARDFRRALATAALVVLGLSYAGLILLPNAAMHTATGPAVEHAGLWRGIYPHKNIAGPIMAMLLFSGCYVMRCGQRRLGLLVVVLSAVFIYNTGSKTTLALVPVVATLVVGGRLIGGRTLPPLILFVALVVTGLATLGSAISPALDSILQAVMPGTTFTGRIDLWRFTLDQLRNHAWTGFGFESFWDTANVFKAELPFELSWDPRGIVNSHSGYLDIAVWAGWPALAIALVTLVVLPFKDYVTTRQTVENQRLADLFLMILAFALLNSFMETVLFSRANPVWMFAWISIVGLRLCGRFRLA